MAYQLTLNPSSTSVCIVLAEDLLSYSDNTEKTQRVIEPSYNTNHVSLRRVQCEDQLSVSQPMRCYLQNPVNELIFTACVMPPP